MLQHNDAGAQQRSPVVAQLAVAVRSQLPGLATRFAEQMVLAEPVYGERFTRAERIAACRENLGALLDALVSGRDDIDWQPHQATGQRNADMEVPLESLLHLYRLAAQMIWHELITACEHDLHRRDALLEAAAWVWTIVDLQSAMVTEAYNDRVQRITQDRTAKRAAAIATLLTGAGGDPSAAGRAAMTLGLVEGPLTAVAHPNLPEGRTHLVESALGGRGIRSVWQIRGSATLGVIAAATVPPDLRLPVPVGMDPGVTDLREVGAAVERALLALRAAPTAGPGAVVGIGEVLLGAILVRSPDLGDRLVAEVLGDAETWRVVHGDLLQTFEVWYRCGGDAGAAARQLYCHRNTVFNRLRRLQDLSGRRLTDPRDVAHLVLAAQALALSARH